MNSNEHKAEAARIERAANDALKRISPKLQEALAKQLKVEQVIGTPPQASSIAVVASIAQCYATFLSSAVDWSRVQNPAAVIASARSQLMTEFENRLMDRLEAIWQAQAEADRQELKQ